jgi:hypothetical protein
MHLAQYLINVQSMASGKWQTVSVLHFMKLQNAFESQPSLVESIPINALFS